MKFADYERRLVAFLVDLAFSIIVATLILSVCGILIDEFTLSIAMKIFIPGFCFILFLYLTFAYRVFKGVSIGGAMCNVRIVNKDGTDLRLKTAIIRSALLALLLLSIYNIFYMFLLRTQVSFFDESTDTRAIQRHPIEDDYNAYINNK